MALEKNDLDQIGKKVKKIVESSAEDTKTVLRKEIRETVNGSENRIITVVSREITDLAEINRAVIQKVDKIAELEKRIIRLETKAGIR